MAMAEEAEPTLASAISGLREPRAGLYTAGQPDVGAWTAAARHGVTTVVDLRPENELAGRDEAAEVAAAGLAYHRLPVAGAGDVNMDNAEQLRQLIEQAPGPVLVHCASGNRVGALLALGAAKGNGMTTEQAIAFGRDAGLGSLEPRVREVLESAPAAE
ncbi:MAG TPA: sulfur transferase domain-containing protein [Lysobacter sp.]|nr:sulfur transferase domain-containing protein [Lysobacter sp.]